MGIPLITFFATVVMIASISLPVAHEAAAIDLSARPPDALQQQWNDMMLMGRFARILNGQVTRMGSESSLTNRGTSFVHDSNGWVFEASMTAWGVWVGDFRERRYVLMSKGGWELEGGLLRRIDIGDAKLELYGKTIKRHEPFLNPFPHVWFGNESWNFGHEFFLLLRSKDHDGAEILRKWFVADSYDGYGGGLGTLVPRGFLEYDKVSERITVKVMDGHYAGLFIEQVNLRDGSRAETSAFGATNSEIDPDTYASLLTLITMRNEGEAVSQAHVEKHRGRVSFEYVEGWVNQALGSKESVRALTKTGTSICVALLRRAHLGSDRSLELYARKWDCHAKKSSYDFFLLIRPQPHAKATILSQWKMTFDGSESLFQRAFLDYDSISGKAMVHVTDGLDATLLRETVSVSD